MKLADSVSGGGFLPNATQHQPGARSERNAWQRRGEALELIGIVIAAISAIALGLWLAYRLLEGVFSQALLPVPTAFPVMTGAVVVGAAAALVGLVMSRGGAPRRPSTADQLPQDYGRAA